jgi:hypothetical protein
MTLLKKVEFVDDTDILIWILNFGDRKYYDCVLSTDRLPTKIEMT